MSIPSPKGREDKENFINKRMGDSTMTKVFICFVIILLFLLCTGCSTMKHRWIWDHKPEDKPSMTGPANEYNKDVGGIKINVLEVSF